MYCRKSPLLCCFVIPISVFAQDPPSPNIRVDSTLVLVPVTVTDASNRYVLGLEKQDFHVFEDDAEQQIKQFSGEDAPLSVGLIVDTSGSIGTKMDLCRQAVAQLMKTMNSEDEAFLVEFSDRAELVVGFTHNPNDVVEKVAAARSGGMTALFDGLYAGLREMKKAHNPRKTLVVISDGGENSSVFSAKEVMQLASEANVQIYAMGVFEPIASAALTLAEMGGPRLLAGIAEQTGGRTFAAATLSELPTVASRIAIELRNQYLLAYAPANQVRDGKYHRVKVEVKPPAGVAGLKARWRPGYYAPLN